MLENIKNILGITDDSEDKIINQYINKFTQKTLNYCHIKKLPEELKGFVEDKVIAVMQYRSQNSSMSCEKKIKSVERGDTRIEYSVDEKDERTLLSFGNEDIHELNIFRRVAW
ncbi:phage head-tail connector protein [Clostridium sp. JS66]|uniref:phage head-tail connector protein n=1 Tax=Clostridium sp. JS66 TaxID=3064705 RepID=UPI00298E269B|nr:phage head-tail connector protein [Clostridium sp. JS66]WPC40627.1 phage head-tail connector protein [Clostridium sp. JS66]